MCYFFAVGHLLCLQLWLPLPMKRLADASADRLMLLQMTFGLPPPFVFLPSVSTFGTEKQLFSLVVMFRDEVRVMTRTQEVSNK